MKEFNTCASLPANFWTVRNFVEFDKIADEAAPMLREHLKQLPLEKDQDDLVHFHLQNHMFTYKCEQDGIDINGNDIYQLDLTIGNFELHAKAFVIDDMDGAEAYHLQHTQTFFENIDEVEEASLLTMVRRMVEAEHTGDGSIPHLVKVDVTPKLKPLVELYEDLHKGDAYLSASTYQVGKGHDDVITIQQVVIAKSDPEAIETVMSNELECLTCVERNLSKLNSLDAWVLGSQLQRLLAAEPQV